MEPCLSSQNQRKRPWPEPGRQNFRQRRDLFGDRESHFRIRRDQPNWLAALAILHV
jgi:hypothetical protein